MQKKNHRKILSLLREKDRYTDDRKKKREKKGKCCSFCYQICLILSASCFEKRNDCFAIYSLNKTKKKEDVKEKQRIFQIRENKR